MSDAPDRVVVTGARFASGAASPAVPQAPAGFAQSTIAAFRPRGGPHPDFMSDV